jgi:hypothetical protein
MSCLGIYITATRWLASLQVTNSACADRVRMPLKVAAGSTGHFKARDLGARATHM